MNTVSDWLGAASFALSAFTIFYLLGVKFARIETKMDLVWKVLIEDNLMSSLRAGHVSKSSPYKIDEKLFLRIEGKTRSDIGLAVFTKLANCKKPMVEEADIIAKIIKETSWEFVVTRSIELGIPLGEYLGLWVTALKQAWRGEGSSWTCRYLQVTKEEIKKPEEV